MISNPPAPHFLPASPATSRAGARPMNPASHCRRRPSRAIAIRLPASRPTAPRTRRPAAPRSASQCILRRAIRGRRPRGAALRPFPPPRTAEEEAQAAAIPRLHPWRRGQADTAGISKGALEAVAGTSSPLFRRHTPPRSPTLISRQATVALLPGLRRPPHRLTPNGSMPAAPGRLPLDQFQASVRLQPGASRQGQARPPARPGSLRRSAAPRTPRAVPSRPPPPTGAARTP